MGSYEDTMLKLEKMAQANTATQMNWQEKMTKSSHQMEVADLVKAGLNPVLSSGGNGAQSYTTSVDSAVNGIAGMASAREGANATRYAARQQAAAMRASAAANLAAARYAANMAYAQNQYSWDKKTSIQEGINKNELEKIRITPPKNLSEFIWKATENSGINKTVFTSKLVKGINNSVSMLCNDPSKFFKETKNTFLSIKNFALNNNGVKAVNSELQKLGLSKIASVQRLFIKAFVFKDYSSMVTIARMVNSKKGSSAARR